MQKLRGFRKFGGWLAALALMVTLMSPAAPTLSAFAATTTPTTSASQAHVTSIIQSLQAAGANADKIWSTLSPADQKAVQTALTPVGPSVTETTKGTTGAPTSTGSAGAAALSTYCRWAQVQVYYKNVFGMKLVAYFQRINWCYNGSTVTSHSRTRWGEAYAPFWQFKGNIGSSEAGGTGHTYYRSWTQGSFALCLPYIGCGQYKYPWISMTVYRNGSWSHSYGG